MRIGIVNDKRDVADSLRRIIGTQPDLQTAWIAFDGEDAVRRAAGDKPDLILMDLAMPRLGGIEATRKIMTSTPCAILIVTPAVSVDAAVVFRAMGFGALDAVNTPVGVAGEEALLAKIRTIGRLIGMPRVGLRTTMPPQPGVRPISEDCPPLVVIGSSTGGPKALAAILASMSGPPRAPIVVVQHVDEKFAAGLASWLAQQAPFPVRTAVEGEAPRAGEMIMAESNDHLVLASDLTFRYVQKPEIPYRPSVDVFFKNVAQVWPGPGIAVLLTGMGSDGGQGMLALRRRGWHTIAQDRATSVIYGMPKAAVELSAAAQVLPVDEIGRAIELQLSALMTPRPSGPNHARI